MSDEIKPEHTIDANELGQDTQPPGDGRFDAVYMNAESEIVVTLGDGKTGFQNSFTSDLESVRLHMVRFNRAHTKDDVTEEDFKTVTKPFLCIDFDNERALDSVIEVLTLIKKRWEEKKLAKTIRDGVLAELEKQIEAQKCPHDPTQTTGAVGMYHCPDCGEMVIAGVAHPPADDTHDTLGEDQ